MYSVIYKSWILLLARKIPLNISPRAGFFCFSRIWSYNINQMIYIDPLKIIIARAEVIAVSAHDSNRK